MNLHPLRQYSVPAALLELTDDLAVVGEAANGRGAVALARSTRPDVVFMDIRMPVLDGLEVLIRDSCHC